VISGKSENSIEKGCHRYALTFNAIKRLKVALIGIECSNWMVPKLYDTSGKGA
jgi:hypothetical protein